MEIVHGSDLKPTRDHSTSVHRKRGVPTRKGTAITRRLPLTPNFRQTEMYGGDGVARQRVLIGDSPDDEQWGDDLSNPSLHQPTCLNVAIMGNHEPESDRGRARRNSQWGSFRWHSVFQ